MKNPFRGAVLRKQAAEKFLHGKGREIRKKVDTVVAERTQAQKNFENRSNNKNHYKSWGSWK